MRIPFELLGVLFSAGWLLKLCAGPEECPYDLTDATLPPRGAPTKILLSPIGCNVTNQIQAKEKPWVSDSEYLCGPEQSVMLTISRFTRDGKILWPEGVDECSFIRRVTIRQKEIKVNKNESAKNQNDYDRQTTHLLFGIFVNTGTDASTIYDIAHGMGARRSEFVILILASVSLSGHIDSQAKSAEISIYFEPPPIVENE